MTKPLRGYLGSFPDVGNDCFIDPTAVLIGDVKLADNCSIWPLTVLRGDVQRIEVGPRTNIQDGTVVHTTHDGPHSPGGLPTIIGADVTVGHKAILHACTIGDRCLIGMGAIVMDGVVIESDVLLAAGSMVTPGKRLESGHLYCGSPARKLRALSSSEIERLAYSAAHYVRVKNNYMQAED